MPTPLLEIHCAWKGIRFSFYQRGEISSAPEGIYGIYRNRFTRRIRLYATINLHGAVVEVNREDPVRVESRGRFGKLYLEV